MQVKAQAIDLKHSNFEDGTTQSWSARYGHESAVVTTEQKYNGKYALFVSNRQRMWDGCKINVTDKIQAGSRYQVTFFAKFASETSSNQIEVMLESSKNGTKAWQYITSKVLSTVNGWELVTATFDLKLNDYDSLILYIDTISGTSPFYIDDFKLSYDIESDIPSLHEYFSSNFPIGAAVGPSQISGSHGALLAKHFNSIVAENKMKWPYLQPKEGTFTFEEADKLVEFAEANNMKVRGHTLVWHGDGPGWLFKDAAGNDLQPSPESKAIMLKRLKDHIQAVMTHYKSRIRDWDVVNEVVDDNQPDGLRHSKWYELTGSEYIEEAFRIAAETDPNARLFLNDYTTTIISKRNAIYKLCLALRNKGIRVDGVGHQMHSNIEWPSTQSIVDTVYLFNSIGLDNQITELDISVYKNATDSYTTIPEEILIKQAYRYRNYFQIFMQLKDKISSVTLWGLADDRNWLKEKRLDAPLLFDNILHAKYAYWGVLNQLRLSGSDLNVHITSDYKPSKLSTQIPLDIVVRNYDIDHAYNVTMSATVPPNTTFNSLLAPLGASCNTPSPNSIGVITCTIPSLGKSEGNVFKLILNIKRPVATGEYIPRVVWSEPLQFTANATSTSNDPIRDNNSATYKSSMVFYYVR